jgi:hypothetical protein
MLVAKAKVFQYRIQYIDNTYQLVDWTKAEFDGVFGSMAEDKKVAKVADDLFRLDDIRAIVFLPPIPEPTKEEKLAETEGQLSEWGFVDPDTAQWLKDQGIKLGGDS